MVCTYDPCVQKMMQVCRICEKHDVATSSARIDDVCTTPDIICSEMEPCNFVMVDEIFFYEYKICIVVISGGRKSIGRCHSKARTLWEGRSFLLQHLLDARE